MNSIWSALYGFLRKPLNLISFSVVMIYLFCALAVEGYSIYCRQANIIPVYERGDIQNRFQNPSTKHWFGTDYLGRDVFFRAVAGTSTAVKVGVLASFITLGVGVTLGVVGGFFRGWVDDFVVWVYSTFATMPSLLFVLAFALLVSKGFLCPPLAAAFNGICLVFNTEPGMMAVYLGIGITGWVGLCQVVRAETFKLREAGYVQAAKVAGLHNFRIILRHIVPNVLYLVIIYFTIRFAGAVMTEVIVSYLGLGVQQFPSWGTMIADGQERLWQGIWWEVAGATAFMFILVLSLNILGDALRDYLDPRLSS